MFLCDLMWFCLPVILLGSHCYHYRGEPAKVQGCCYSPRHTWGEPRRQLGTGGRIEGSFWTNAAARRWALVGPLCAPARAWDSLNCPSTHSPPGRGRLWWEGFCEEGPRKRFCSVWEGNPEVRCEGGTQEPAGLSLDRGDKRGLGMKVATRQMLACRKGFPREWSCPSVEFPALQRSERPAQWPCVREPKDALTQSAVAGPFRLQNAWVLHS